MNDAIPKDLSRLDAHQRLNAFDAALLDRTPDPELERLVVRATEVSGFPIALVSLVVDQIQFFRAQAGLPPELASSRATDRCISFCQYVVAGDQPLKIEDATKEPALPTELVDTYGIRAYVGFPLRVAGQTVGSFCVIDGKPGRLEPKQLEELQALAQAASARLETLARKWAPPANAAEEQSHRAWMAVAETQSLMSLSEQFASGKLSLEEFQRALSVLAALSGKLEPAAHE
ncbi:GAF domain-containing protein [Hyalangium rubrum]|uniref:GAF domain-containing protein n=1 Tax=Hyalangium rubrum TaxID=3103134 RepID=A0ABU5HFT3_9BACT|nr:GAF domain-containing protein [Hyalangium sp. s54d21]MDY7232328.1 GAF domain-containing protein [Hyalangium sp. s54d21]